MIHVTTPATSVATPSPLTALVGRVYVPTANHKPAFMPAMPTEPMQRRDGSVQQLTRRAVLLSKIAHALSLRQCKAASVFEAELRALNHSILKEGLRK